ncbi:MAG: phosphatase PAP2 family protein [Candidatus Pacearchaeota archaeon]|nr:phosphatase PAP2 family protein [Candidatus Pacearchaeota archaeon]
MNAIKKNKKIIVFITILALFIISLIFDSQFLSLIELLKCPATNSFFRWVLKFENEILIYYPSIFVFTVFVLLLKKRKRQIFSYIISLAVLAFLTLILKFSIARPRPNNSTVHSFPSGHSAMTFASLPFFSKLDSLQTFWFTISCVFAMTRIWFGMHYLSDVIAGAAIGYYIPAIIQKIFERRKHKKRHKEEKNKRRKK